MAFKKQRMGRKKYVTLRKIKLKASTTRILNY